MLVILNFIKMIWLVIEYYNESNKMSIVIQYWILQLKPGRELLLTFIEKLNIF